MQFSLMGGGLARLGLEQAGHTCTGFEVDPCKHHLSTLLGSGRSELADVRGVDLDGFDAVWASPPCQFRSVARTQGLPVSPWADNLLEWSLALPHATKWIENVFVPGDQWGRKWNAAQFTATPLQCRTRVIGGAYLPPEVFRPYRASYGPGVCPCVVATEWKGCATDKRRASRFYGRKLTLQECAHHQGLSIPRAWLTPPSWFRGNWNHQLYEAIGNGVPVYMARAFGAAYTGE